MDIIKSRQESRERRIGEIKASILKAMEEGKDIKKKDIVMAAILNIGISKRTASEYVDISLASIDQDNGIQHS